MPNMTMTKLPMPEQDPKVRARNFEEVSYGYTEEMAVEEAQRCLHCKHMPCVSGCPVGIPIPDFLAKVAEGDFDGAYDVITQRSSLPAAVYARRRPSVKPSACAASRASRLPSAVWSALRLTGI